jgi:hypothetical protein
MTDSIQRPATEIAASHVGTVLRAINTDAPEETINLVRDVQQQAAEAIGSLAWPVRHTARRQLQVQFVSTLGEVIRAKLQAAADAEIACFVQARMAQRQVAAVHAMQNESAMRGLMAMALSEVSRLLMQITAAHEDHIDDVAGAWANALRTKCDGGVIGAEEAERRRRRLEARAERNRFMVEDECDLLIDSFRVRLRGKLAGVQPPE